MRASARISRIAAVVALSAALNIFAVVAEAGAQSRSAAGVSASGATPEALARGYLGALNRNDWAGAAALMHPHALATMREFTDALVEADESGNVARLLVGVSSRAEVAGLSNEELFGRFLRATLAGESASMLQDSRSVVLGHISEGRDTAHVLYRMQMQSAGIEISQVGVLSVARSAEGWRALLTAEIANVIGELVGGGR